MTAYHGCAIVHLPAEMGSGRVSHASVVGQAALARLVMTTHEQEQAGLSARLPPDHAGLHARLQDC